MKAQVGYDSRDMLWFNFWKGQYSNKHEPGYGSTPNIMT